MKCNAGNIHELEGDFSGGEVEGGLNPPTDHIWPDYKLFTTATALLYESPSRVVSLNITASVCRVEERRGEERLVLRLPR